MYSGNKTDYDRAINPYQFHVQRFHIWPNYYSAFTGVLFVSFYTMLENETTNKVTPAGIYVDGVLKSGNIPIKVDVNGTPNITKNNLIT